MKKSVLFILIVPFIFSQKISSLSGAYNINLNSRAAGMSFAFTAVANDANAIAFNPAGMLQCRGADIGFSYSKVYQIIPAYEIFGRYLFDDEIAFGMQLSNNGDELFSETEFKLAVAYDLFDLTTIDYLFFGASLAYRSTAYGNLHEGINYIQGNASGFGLDLSFFYQLHKNINFGFNAKNILNTMRWDYNSAKGSAGNSDESLAREYIFGMNYHHGKFENLSIDYATGLSNEVPDNIRLGLEFDLYGIILPRFGFKQNIFSDKDNLNREYSFGLGIIANAFLVNFSYNLKDFSNQYHIGMNVKL
jgi:hypothetical protein